MVKRGARWEWPEIVSALTEKLAETTARRMDWIMKTRRRRKRCGMKNSYTKYRITYRR